MELDINSSDISGIEPSTSDLNCKSFNNSNALNHSDARAVKKAVEEGKNPLDSSKFERWEDQVGVDRIINRRVLELEPLPTPAQVLGELPLSQHRVSQHP